MTRQTATATAAFAIALTATLCAFAPARAQTTAPTTTPSPTPPIDVTTLGVIPDGTTLNTAALQRAIDDCTTRGGGTLRFPAGRYLTGTIQLKDDVTLQLDEGAILLGSTDAADYRNVDPFTAGDGGKLGYALIVAMDARNVAVVGTGTIDGQGKTLSALQKPYTVRPFLMRWIRCHDVRLEGVTLRDPGAWSVHFFQCRKVAASDLTIRCYTTGLMNNDGIDVDSCEDVRITRCDIESGDDAICLKATSVLPCRDVTVTDCRLKTKCNAIKLGTESLGDFKNIRISGCRVRDIGMAGIALYCVDGGHLQDVVVEDVTMDGVTVPISVRLGARLKTFRPGDQAKPPGVLRDVTVRGLRVTRAARIGMLINGVPGHPVERLRFQDVRIEVAGGGTAEDAKIQLPEKPAAYPEMNMFGKVLPAYGVYLRHARDVSFKDVEIVPTKADARPATVLIDAEQITGVPVAAAATTAPSAPR